MIRGEDFIDALGLPDEDFTNTVDAALRLVKEREARPVMKRKMTLTMLAAVLAVIMLTGAALAVGLNLFDHFGRYDRRLQIVAPDAAVEDAAAVEITTEVLGVTKAKIDSAYYDGQSLIVAYTLDNYEHCEAFTPTESELAQMTEYPDYAIEAQEVPEDEVEANVALQAARDKKQPYGLIECSIGIGDHCFTDDGVDLPPSVDSMEDGDDGMLYCIREFETPLPAAAQNRDSLRLRLPIRLDTTWLYFDGEKYYCRYAQEPLAEMTATASRADAVTRSYHWEGELNNIRVSAKAQVSAVHVKLKIEAEAALPDPAALWPEVSKVDDTWYSFVLTDSKGLKYNLSEMAEADGCYEAEYDGLGYLPDDLILTVCLDGEGEWNADEHILPGYPVTLKPE